jgi:hypothetical protein
MANLGILVEFEPGRSLFDQGGLLFDLEPNMPSSKTDPHPPQ